MSHWHPVHILHGELLRFDFFHDVRNQLDEFMLFVFVGLVPNQDTGKKKTQVLGGFSTKNIIKEGYVKLGFDNKKFDFQPRFGKTL